MSDYGKPPVSLGSFTPEWEEFMHYLYLPVRMPGSDFRLPPNLDFMRAALWRAVSDCWVASVHPNRWLPYVYVSAVRGFATPGNPLNRPGWHCDDFGGEDINYIWSDRYPTRFLQLAEGSGVKLGIPADDQESMTAFDWLAANASKSYPELSIETYPDSTILRLDPYVIHTTPVIPAPGGMRSFFKISLSEHRYNLRGNSHNHLFDYDWPMHDRAVVRNQQDGPQDYVEDTG